MSSAETPRRASAEVSPNLEVDSSPRLSVGDLAERVAAGDRRALARLLSVIEQTGSGAAVPTRKPPVRPGGAHTIGITGPPGAGKSSVVDRLVGAARDDHERVGVIAVDPSSPVSGGALLGDRLRLDRHADDDGVFVRSMAARGHLGGLATATPEAIRAFETWGAGAVILETVGVGQSEVEVASSADTVVVVLAPGFGDSIQAAKAGVLEIADVLVVNKSDVAGAADAVRWLEANLRLGEHSGWEVPVLSTCAPSGTGIGELWQTLVDHRSYLGASGELRLRRRRQLRDELQRRVAASFQQSLVAAFAEPSVAEIVTRVAERELDLAESVDLVVGHVLASASARLAEKGRSQ